jgi:cephalosporin-C deacetylase-like acetyl esterase
LIRGGAWDDNHYRFAEPAQAPPFDRSEKNGFRTALYLEPEKLPESVFARLEWSAPKDPYAQTPVSDEIFELYKEQFAYDKTPLNAEVESMDDSNRDWIHERVTLDAAYGNERLILHLFFPKNAPPPYQTVVYFPGGESVFQTSSDDITSYYEFTTFLSFLLKTGRAVVYPVYKGTFERRDDALIAHVPGDDSYAYAQWVVEIVKDFRRTIDYLETRSEIDQDKLAYYGMSWGGVMAPVIPAVEDRIKVILAVAGGLRLRGRPEVNPINYVGRVKVPTLMMNGRYDTLLGETISQAMFNLLGTPDEHKALRLFETDHIPPLNEFIKQSLDWLDRYLGPVEGI